MAKHAANGRKRRAWPSGCLPAALTIGSILLVGGVWVLQRVPGESSWLGALLTYAPQMQWLAPPAVALIVTVTMRRGLLSLVNAAVLIGVLLGPVGLELNRAADSPPGWSTVRVATWNVYGYTRARDVVRDRIMSWDCDIVCLEEAGGATFADLLPGYESVVAGDLRTYVRGRIADHRVIRTQRSRVHAMLEVQAETDAGPVRVVSVHFPRTTHARSMPRRIEPLARYVEMSVRVRDHKFEHLGRLLPPQEPMLIMGDMNTPPTSRYWRSLRAQMTDCFDVVGRGLGYSFVWRRRWPILRIDYVWAGGGATPLRCWTEEAAPSDHRPVLAEIALPPAGHGGGGERPEEGG